MKRHIIIGSSIILGVNKLCWFIYIHWNFTISSLTIFEFVLITGILLSRIINYRGFYLFVQLFCILYFFFYSAVIFINFQEWETITLIHKLWWLVRPVFSLITIVTIISIIKELNTNSVVPNTT